MDEGKNMPAPGATENGIRLVEDILELKAGVGSRARRRPRDVLETDWARMGDEDLDIFLRQAVGHVYSSVSIRDCR